MKQKFHLITHYMKNIPEERPVFETPEGHNPIISRAHFNIMDFDRVIDRARAFGKNTWWCSVKLDKEHSVTTTLKKI